MWYWWGWSGEKPKENKTVAKKAQEERAVVAAVAENEQAKEEVEATQKCEDDFNTAVAAADLKMEM